VVFCVRYVASLWCDFVVYGDSITHFLLEGDKGVQRATPFIIM